MQHTHMEHLQRPVSAALSRKDGFAGFAFTYRAFGLPGGQRATWWWKEQICASAQGTSSSPRAPSWAALLGGCLPLVRLPASLGPAPTCPHGRGWEVQPNLPRDGVCNLKIRRWKNRAGFSALGCLFPSGRAATSSGHHELLSGHPGTLSRELTCPQNRHCSAQSLFRLRRWCLRQRPGR